MTQKTSEQNWSQYILGAALAAFGLKMYLALTTYGTNDVVSWETFLTTQQAYGGVGLYHRVDEFIHPPFVIHLLSFLDFIRRSSFLSLPFLLRLPAILADLGSILLVWKILAINSSVERDPRAVFAMALSPISVMVSGFHGNTDPLMIFFVLMSVYLIEANGSIFLAGAALGLATNIKIVPVIFLPTILLYLYGMRERAIFLFGAVTAFGFTSLPYLLQDPIFIIARLFGYESLYGQWGFSRVYVVFALEFFPSLVFKYASLGKVLIFASIVGASIWMNRFHLRPSLFLQLGLVIFLFMVLTPGFSIQYLAWLVPWVVGLGLGATLAYYTAGGIFQFSVYSFWTGGFPWYYADSIRVGSWRGPLVNFELLCWAVVVVITYLYVRTLARRSMPPA
jgi:4-amino-4-deoxy-L-arabinose transferase-like glycosyltransferase